LALQARHLLLIQRDEVDGIEQKRRKTAVHHCTCDNFPREGKQKPRTLDHQQRRDVFLRDVLQAEDAGIEQVEAEQRRAGNLGLAFQLQLDLEIRGRHRLGVDVDLHADRRLLRRLHQRPRRVRILEGEILDELGKNVERRPRRGLRLLRSGRRFPAICGRGHMVSSPPVRCRASGRRASGLWLTQPPRGDKEPRRSRGQRKGHSDLCFREAR
jgi:hypothetical protein